MSVANNLIHLQKKIANAALQAGREGSGVTLVAVSKQQPDDKITEVLKAGVRVFGENRVQEAQERWTDFRAQYPDLKLHLIGPLQTNKTREAVALFDVIETLDRKKLADALAAEMKKQGRNLPCFIQVNTGAEPQGAWSGCARADVHPAGRRGAGAAFCPA
jgi:pyridoxal phosphate enzyme (YggS family)